MRIPTWTGLPDLRYGHMPPCSKVQHQDQEVDAVAWYYSGTVDVLSHRIGPAVDRLGVHDCPHAALSHRRCNLEFFYFSLRMAVWFHMSGLAGSRRGNGDIIAFDLATATTYNCNHSERIKTRFGMRVSSFCPGQCRSGYQIQRAYTNCWVNSASVGFSWQFCVYDICLIIRYVYR